MATDIVPARVGDWVACYRGGRIVYALVQYIGKTITGRPELHTSEGTISPDSVLEARRAPAPTATVRAVFAVEDDK